MDHKFGHGGAGICWALIIVNGILAHISRPELHHLESPLGTHGPFIEYRWKYPLCPRNRCRCWDGIPYSCRQPCPDFRRGSCQRSHFRDDLLPLRDDILRPPDGNYIIGMIQWFTVRYPYVTRLWWTVSTLLYDIKPFPIDWTVSAHKFKTSTCTQFSDVDEWPEMLHLTQAPEDVRNPLHRSVDRHR